MKEGRKEGRKEGIETCIVASSKARAILSPAEERANAKTEWPILHDPQASPVVLFYIYN